jgi:hypothetical protein
MSYLYFDLRVRQELSPEQERTGGELPPELPATA